MFILSLFIGGVCLKTTTKVLIMSRKPTYQMKWMKEGMSKDRDPLGGEVTRDFTSSERKIYGDCMREYRAKFGLVDGLRTDREGFSEYLRKRREEDEKARGYR